MPRHTQDGHAPSALCVCVVNILRLLPVCSVWEETRVSVKCPRIPLAPDPPTNTRPHFYTHAQASSSHAA